MENRRFVPNLIIEKYRKRIFADRVQGSVLFLDIVGFSDMTRLLMKNGKEGAEILSEIIAKVFKPSIDAIYENNGFITNFAGDAFTAVFRRNDCSSAFNAAAEIKTVFRKIGKQSTKFGDFQLAFRIGISFGNIGWKIIESSERNTFYFHGIAVERALKAEKESVPDEIIFDEKCLAKIPEGIVYHEKSDGFFCIEYFSLKKISQRQKRDTSADQFNFIPNSVREMKTSGEFREIIPCFLILPENRNLEKIVPTVIKETIKFGGFFKDINISGGEAVVLIYFGAPKTAEKIFQRAADFALRLKIVLKKDFKIALTFGTVFSGFIENKNRSEYLAMGKVVNLAARISAISKWDGIYVDEEFSRFNRNHYNFKPIGEKALKGFEQKIPVYELVSKKISAETEPEKTKIFGRKNELQTLFDFIKPLQKNRFCGTVYIHGIAGIGKTRLTEEFKEELMKYARRRKFDFSWFLLPCDEIIPTSFNPIIHFLKEYFSQSEDNTSQKNNENFEHILTKLIARIKNRKIKNELIRTKSILGALIGLYWKNSLFEQLDSKGRFQNILYAFKNFIIANSLLKPVILQIEDAHWIDNDSLKLLEILTANIEKYPLAVILSCRLQDDGSPVDFGLENVSTKKIVLDHLGKNAVKSLVKSKFENQISPELFNLILEKSEGNPFYIEQIILYIKENKLNFEKNYLSFKIPSTINAIIVARIDKLSSELKETVKTASVLGCEFAIKILSLMLQNKNIKDSLKEGDRENIWKAISEIKYIFKHSLIRESVYQMQLKKQLRRLHKLAADSIETLYRNNLTEHFEELANHFEKAEQTDKAVYYFEKAANKAKENYQNEPAINFFDHLLKNIAKSNGYEKLKIDVLNAQGEIYKLIGKWKEAEQNFIDSVRLSQKSYDQKRLIISRNNLGLLKSAKGLYEDSLRFFRQNLELSKAVEYKIGEIKALKNIGVVHTNRDEYRQAVEFLGKALALSRKLKIQKQIALCYSSLGILYKKMGNYEKAMEYYRRKAEISQKTKDIKGLYRVYNNIGNILSFQGDYLKAEENFRKSLILAKKTGDIFSVGMITGNLGIVYMNRRQFSKALNFYRKALDICVEINDKVGIAINCGNMGIVFSKQGKFDAAMKCYRKRIKMNEETGDKSGTAFAYGNIGNVMMETGKYEKAIVSYRKMLEISKDIDYKIGIILAKGNLGAIYALSNKDSLALKYFDKSIKLERELDLKNHLMIDLSGKAKILIKQNKYEEARKVISEALKIADSVQDGEANFTISILAKKIEFLTSDNSEKKFEIIQSFLEMTNQTKMPEEKADLFFEITVLYRQLERPQETQKYKSKAIKMFKELYEKKPKNVFKDKIRQLEKL